MAPIPFHLAFPVHDLAAARRFYGEVLGCPEARSSEDSIEFDFFGHQIVAHLAPAEAGRNATLSKMSGDEVGGDDDDLGDDEVPPRHFGAVFAWKDWEQWVARLRSAGIRFLFEPQVLDKGPGGEQATFFFRDPSGNVLEFKSFRDPDRMFARRP